MEVASTLKERGSLLKEIVPDFEDDDDTPVDYSSMKHAAELSQSKSQIKKMASALVHVNKFLADSNLFPFKTFDEILPEHINDRFLGLLATYFGKEAKSIYKNKGKPLAYLTAVGYMSAFKSSFILKYRHLKELPPFLQQDRWHSYLSSIYKLKYKYAIENGQVNRYMFVCLIAKIVH